MGKAGKMCEALEGACEAFQRDFPECRRPVVNAYGQWVTIVGTEHILEGAEYNTDCPNAFETTQGVYVAVMCKRCGVEANYVPSLTGNGTRYWVREKTND